MLRILYSYEYSYDTRSLLLHTVSITKFTGFPSSSFLWLSSCQVVVLLVAVSPFEERIIIHPSQLVWSPSVVQKVDRNSDERWCHTTCLPSWLYMPAWPQNRFAAVAFYVNPYAKSLLENSLSIPLYPGSVVHYWERLGHNFRFYPGCQNDWFFLSRMSKWLGAIQIRARVKYSFNERSKIN
jgi:hypothetical protein